MISTKQEVKSPIRENSVDKNSENVMKTEEKSQYKTTMINENNTDRKDSELIENEQNNLDDFNSSRREKTRKDLNNNGVSLHLKIYLPAASLVCLFNFLNIYITFKFYEF